jgi:hypothetical protein
VDILHPERIDCRGWKEICAFLGVSKNTAKKILKRHKLLRHDGGKPLLSIAEYEMKLYGLSRK